MWVAAAPRQPPHHAGCLPLAASPPSGAAVLAPSALLQQAPAQHGQERKAQKSSSSCQQLLKQDLERSQNQGCRLQPPSLVGNPLAGAGFGCGGGKLGHREVLLSHPKAARKQATRHRLNQPSYFFI